MCFFCISSFFFRSFGRDTLSTVSKLFLIWRIRFGQCTELCIRKVSTQQKLVRITRVLTWRNSPFSFGEGWSLGRVWRRQLSAVFTPGLTFIVRDDWLRHLHSHVQSTWVKSDCASNTWVCGADVAFQAHLSSASSHRWKHKFILSASTCPLQYVWCKFHKKCVSVVRTIILHKNISNYDVLWSGQLNKEAHTKVRRESRKMIGCVLWRIDLVLFCVWRVHVWPQGSRHQVCLFRTKQKADYNMTKRWKKPNERVCGCM